LFYYYNKMLEVIIDIGICTFLKSIKKLNIKMINNKVNHLNNNKVNHLNLYKI